MRINIEPLTIEKRPENRITSHHLYAQKNGLNTDIAFHRNGIFSREIFGQFGQCDCGQVVGEGYCPHCHTRVVDREHLPNYYIDLDFYVPKLNADFKPVKKVAELLRYEAVLVENDCESTIVPLASDEDWENLGDVDAQSVSWGLEAAKKIQPSVARWAKTWMTDFVAVPHPDFRPVVKQPDGKLVLSEVNRHLLDLLTKLKESSEVAELADDADLRILLFYHAQAVYAEYLKFEQEVYRLFCRGKNSLTHTTLRGHGIVNTIRGVCVNRFDVAEDIILIGDTFVAHLYPHLWEKHGGNLEAINNELIANGEIVLVDRQPTISANSIVALRPRVASCYAFGTFSDGGYAPNEASEHVGENDTLGIRTLGVNPLIMGGLAGDFDGDTLLVIPLYDKENKLLAAEMLASENYLNPANGEIKNAIPHEVAYL